MGRRRMSVWNKTLVKRETGDGLKMGGGSWSINLDEIGSLKGAADIETIQYNLPSGDRYVIDYAKAQEKGFMRILGGEKKLVVPKNHWTHSKALNDEQANTAYDEDVSTSTANGFSPSIDVVPITIYKVMNICSAHQLELPYESPCNRLHGHNYKVEVWLEGFPSDHNDMVMDFTYVKEVVNSLDHRNINDIMVGVKTTAENISVWIANQLMNKNEQNKQDGIGAELISVRVRVWETSTCYAEQFQKGGS